jgi:ATP-dependent DNA helicase DinG
MTRIEHIFSEGGILQQSLPYYEERPEQIVMANAVHDAITHPGQLLVEAGCGVGKSFAYLVPLALMSDRTSIVSTATRALQEQLFYKDIPLIKAHIRKGLRYVYIKGRANYLCQYRFEHSRQHSLFDTKEEIQQYHLIQEWAKITNTGDVSELDYVSEYDPVWKSVCCTVDTCLGYKCLYYSTACFLMRLKREARQAHIIVVNHYLFFADMMIQGDAGHSVLPSYHAAVFDEAHMLEDIATRFLGKELGTRDIRSFVSRCRNCVLEYIYHDIHIQRQLLDNLNQLQIVCDSFFLSFGEHRGKWNILYRIEFQYQQTGQDFLHKLGELCDLLGLYADITDELHALIDEAQVYYDALDFFLLHNDPDYVYWVEIGWKYCTITSSPIDVSALFRERLLSKCKHIVFTSATLGINGDFTYMKSRLGLETARDVVIDSPYDFQKQAQLYIPRHHASPKEKEFTNETIELVYDTLIKSQGRAFVLFTSMKHMNIVYKAIKERGLPYTLMKQGEMGRSHIMETKINDIHSVLFATTTYWQGVDVQGEALSCVIIDKLPFAVPNDPVVEARMKRLQDKGHDPFWEYQIPQAALLLRQGVGRLIRSKTDTGIVVIGDRRILTTRYGKIFMQCLPNFKLVKKFEDLNIPRLS